MTKLVLEGTAAPSITPEYIGQLFVNTLGEVAYIAIGTSSSADWKSTSDGGGGGSFGIVPASFDKQDAANVTHTWDIGIDGPLVVRASDGAAAEILLGAATIPSAAEIINNKLILMVGDDTGADIPVTLNITGALSLADVKFLYLDNHLSDSSYDAAKVLTLNGQMLVFDISFHTHPANLSDGTGGTVMCTKIGQYAVSGISNFEGGG